MKLFTCTDHRGHWPVGVASIVLAPSEIQARDLLHKRLAAIGLNSDEYFTLTEIDITSPRAIVLNDGDY